MRGLANLPSAKPSTISSATCLGHKKTTGRAQHAVRRSFTSSPAGTGFFEALNKILASPEAHYDLLELMHACLSLGFEAQYRGLTREDTNLERVRRDVYETLRYFRARASEDISPHWQGLAATMAQSSARLPLWVVAAAASGAADSGVLRLRVFITNEGDAAAG